MNEPDDDDELPPNWDRKAWAESAREYHANRPKTAPKPLSPVPPTPSERERELNARLDAMRASGVKTPSSRLKAPSERSRKIRQMMLDPTVSLERLWNEVNGNRPEYAPQGLVDALMLSLRNRGVVALNEPDTRRRIGELSHKQSQEAAELLLCPKAPHWTAWPETDVKKFIQLYKELRR